MHRIQITPVSNGLQMKEIGKFGVDSGEEALEFYEYNQLGSWVGDKTPGFLVTID